MKKIQLYVDPDKEKEVYNLIEKIEIEGSDGYDEVKDKRGNVTKKRKLKRGYTQDRLKEMLRVYHILSNKYGTIEPYELLDRVLSNQTKEIIKVDTIAEESTKVNADKNILNKLDKIQKNI